MKKLVALLLILSIASTPVFSHSGRQDGQGGHKDNQNTSGLGPYHYHCGDHEAHLHPNGICPYGGASGPTPVSKPDPVNTVPATPSTISVSINGVPVPMSDMAPFIENGRTYVPVRAVLEAYGVDSIGYEAPNVLVSRGADRLKIPVGQNLVIKNEQSIATDSAALIRGGRTCLPIRSVVEALGGTVGWDAATKTVLITKPDRSPAAPVATTSLLKVNFIDVGQGDSIF